MSVVAVSLGVGAAIAIGRVSNFMVALVVFMLSAAILLRVKPRGAASAKTWVVGYIVLGYGVRACALLFDDKLEAPIRSQFLAETLGSELAVALALMALGLAALGLGYFLVAGLGVRRLTARAEPTPRSSRVPAVSAMLFGGLALAFEVRLHARATFLTTGGGDFLLTVMTATASALGAIGVYEFLHRPSRRWAVMALPGLVVVLLELVLLGQKSGLLTIVVSAFVGYRTRQPGHHPSTWRRRLGRWSAGAAVAISVVAAFGVASNADRDGVSHVPLNSLRAIESRTYFVDSVVLVRKYLTTHPPRYGATFAESLTAWIPRQVWPSKPVSVSAWFGREVYWFSPLAGSAFFASGYGGEWYLNFAAPGFVSGWLVLGALAGVVDSKTSGIVRALWIIALVKLVEGPLASQLWLALPLLVAYRISYRPMNAGSAPTAVVLLAPRPSVAQ